MTETNPTTVRHHLSAEQREAQTLGALFSFHVDAPGLPQSESSHGRGGSTPSRLPPAGLAGRG